MFRNCQERYSSILVLQNRPRRLPPRSVPIEFTTKLPQITARYKHSFQIKRDRKKEWIAATPPKCVWPGYRPASQATQSIPECFLGSACPVLSPVQWWPFWKKGLGSPKLRSHAWILQHCNPFPSHCAQVNYSLLTSAEVSKLWGHKIDS